MVCTMIAKDLEYCFLRRNNSQGLLQTALFVACSPKNVDLGRSIWPFRKSSSFPVYWIMEEDELVYKLDARLRISLPLDFELGVSGCASLPFQSRGGSVARHVVLLNIV
jgi:hypothetical protein